MALIHKKRVFKENLFVNENNSTNFGHLTMDGRIELAERVEAVKSIKDSEESIKINKDRLSLNTRIAEIKENTENLSKKFKEIHEKTLANLNSVSSPFNNNSSLFVEQTKQKLTQDYENKLIELNENSTDEIKAFVALFNSRKYVLGKLDEYRKLETYQPSAKRLKYDDNGQRLILLPLDIIKNIVIEDEIYYYYYGFPTQE